jgi:quercetin dioxygenase-like cupin family protein
MRGHSRATAAITLAILGICPALAQPQPTPPKGFKLQPLAAIDLGREFEGMKGRTLRMSYVVVDPGAIMPAHPHKDQPEIIYVMQGTLTEDRNNAGPKDYGPGSVIAVAGDVSHALWNRTSTPVVYIVTPITK